MQFFFKKASFNLLVYFSNYLELVCKVIRDDNSYDHSSKSSQMPNGVFMKEKIQLGVFVLLVSVETVGCHG